MHEIKVVTLSAEEAEHGVAELWAGRQQIAYTVLDDGELKLRFASRRDGAPVVVGLRSLTDALAEIDRVIGAYPASGNRSGRRSDQPEKGRS